MSRRDRHRSRAPPRRDYDRRKKRGADRARPAGRSGASRCCSASSCCCWAAAAAAAGGPGSEGWLVEAQQPARCRRRAASSAPSRPSSWPTSRSRAATMSSASAILARAQRQAGRFAARHRPAGLAPAARGDRLGGERHRRAPPARHALRHAEGAPRRRHLAERQRIHADRPRTAAPCAQAACRRAPRRCCCWAAPARPSMSASCCCCWPTSPPSPRQLRAAVWVGQRRWNLVLNNGVEIWLPEEDAVAALQQLAKLDAPAQTAVARVRRRRSAAAGQALSQETRPGRAMPGPA